jgi:hypothetical protein
MVALFRVPRSPDCVILWVSPPARNRQRLAGLTEREANGALARALATSRRWYESPIRTNPASLVRSYRDRERRTL